MRDAMAISFNLSLSLNNLSTHKPHLFGPRIGTIVHRRAGQSPDVVLQTPTFVTSTSRGVVPHLSRDNIRRTPAVRWVNVPFETFLEHNPPMPTIYPSSNPLHSFLGFEPGKHIVSLSARDPDDAREMPPNGNAVVSVWTLRGVRKLSPSDWRKYTLDCQPDVVVSLSDTPFTDPVNLAYSQKRLTKSIERTARWLSVMLRPWPIENENERVTKPLTAKSDQPESSSIENLGPPPPLPSIFLPMAGGSSHPARHAFASSILEPFYGLEAEAMKHRGLNTLDEGVTGYAFELASLRRTSPIQTNVVGIVEGRGMEPDHISALASMSAESGLPEPISLIQTSLSPLTASKPRLVSSNDGPHEILRYFTHIGVDIFDATWVQRLAGHGVGLDFEFPVRKNRREMARSIGHNLYDNRYALDFGTIADCYRSGAHIDDDRPVCGCAACSPASEGEIKHGVDSAKYSLLSEDDSSRTGDPYTRAYIHHLLHTHEMVAHSLLAMHNLTVLDKFFEGIREFLGSLPGVKEDETWMKRWTEEVDLFEETYDETKSKVELERARKDWKDVDVARGKGRLAREREKEKEKESKEVELLN